MRTFSKPFGLKPSRAPRGSLVERGRAPRAEMVPGDPSHGCHGPGLLATDSRRPGRSSWQDERESRSAFLPAGPSTLEELLDWPMQIVQGIRSSGAPEDEELALRLQTNFAGGVKAYTDYSGMDCPKEAMRLGVLATEKSFGMTFPSPPFTFVRASDKGLLQQRVLADLAQMDGEPFSCLFGDLLERLPPAARQHLEAALPEQGATKQEKSQAYQDIRSWLLSNRAWAFPDDAQSFCYVHGCECPVRPPAQGQKRKRALDVDGPSGAHCDEASHGVAHELALGAGPMRCNIAGVTCVAWSTNGLRGHHAHESEVPHSIWLAERLRMQETGFEHLAFSECTPRYLVNEQLVDPLKSCSKVLHIFDGPELHGWPHRRKRVLSCILNRRLVKWVGPEDYQSDFSRRFHKAVQLDGGILMAAPPHERDQAYVAMARARKNQLHEKTLHKISRSRLLELLVPPGCIERFTRWKEFRDKKGFDTSRAFMCDLDQAPGCKGSVGGYDWPVQLTHGMIMRIQGDNDWTFAVPSDHLTALGFHMHVEPQQGWGVSPLQRIVSALTPAQVKTLTGNGMHLATQCAWMMYVFSNIVRLDIGIEVPRGLSTTAFDVELDVQSVLENEQDPEAQLSEEEEED